MKYTLISPDEFRLMKTYMAVFPEAPMQAIEPFLARYYQAVNATNTFLSRHATKSEWSVSDAELRQQRIYFYAHWSGTRDMEIHFLKKGGKLTMLIDRESEQQAESLGWNQFFSSLGDYDHVVAEEPMAVRQILRALKNGRSIAISIDGNRGSASHFLDMPFSPYMNYRFRSGGLKLALRSGLPISYISSFVDNDTARVTVSRVFGETPREIGASLLSLFRADLCAQPFAWKIWHRVHKDHEIKPAPSGMWLTVGLENEVYLGYTGNGQLVKLPATTYDLITGTNRDYVSIKNSHILEEQLKAA